jgi:hypothetical protein
MIISYTLVVAFKGETKAMDGSADAARRVEHP